MDYYSDVFFFNVYFILTMLMYTDMWESKVDIIVNSSLTHSQSLRQLLLLATNDS